MLSSCHLLSEKSKRLADDLQVRRKVRKLEELQDRELICVGCHGLASGRGFDLRMDHCSRASDLVFAVKDGLTKHSMASQRMVHWSVPYALTAPYSSGKQSQNGHVLRRFKRTGAPRWERSGSFGFLLLHIANYRVCIAVFWIKVALASNLFGLRLTCVCHELPSTWSNVIHDHI